MSKGRLDGKIAIVTGSTSGIGEATARLFAKEGASVVVLGRRKIKGLKIAEEICQSGGNAIFIATDMTQENQIKAMIERTFRIHANWQRSYFYGIINMLYSERLHIVQ